MNNLELQNQANNLVDDVRQSTEQAFVLAGQGGLTIVDLFNTAHVLTQAQYPNLAIELYRLWIENTNSPLSYAVQFNLGSTLAAINDLNSAESAYRAAISQNPAFIPSYVNLGLLLENSGRAEEALSLWREILALADLSKTNEKSQLVQVLNNLGRLLEIHKDFSEAEAMFTRSLLLDSAQTGVLTHWIHLRQKQCEWPVYSDKIDIATKDMIEATSAVAMLSATDDPALQLAAAKRFVTEKVSTPTLPLANLNGYGHEKLRIGYLSSNFNIHAVSLLTVEIYELHDRERVEVYAFCWSGEDVTSYRNRIATAVDHYIRIADMNDEEAAKCIRAQEIDILVDLQGLTSGARPNILSARPAPVQISYLGFPGTTGLPCNDYVIADKFLLPSELTVSFSEKPLYMPNSFQVSDRGRQVGSRPTRAECGLPENAFVFCSFNNNFKFTPEVFGAWMRILEQVPDSVLWLLADNPWAEENLFKSAEAFGVKRERLIFAGRVTPADYLARYQAADLFLDTFPFNAGTTANDALWMGLPLLTYSGRSFASRMAGSLLTTLGLPELITFNLADYEKQAVSLAKNKTRISELKQYLLESRNASPLFDIPQFVRDLEAQFSKVMSELPVIASENQLPLALKQNPETADKVILYHIAYSAQTLLNVGSGYKILNNLDSERNDWREYWPIRKFLLENKLNDESFYGFFSPRFQEKTGLSYDQVVDFVQEAGLEAEVILFSPQPDMGAFFLNIFEQEEVFQPGFIAASEAFLETAGIHVNLATLIMDSRQIVFSNYIVARPKFWREWLTMNEKLFAICEGEESELKKSLVQETSYPGSVQRKVFLMERIASLLLYLNPKWRVKAYNTFDCSWSSSRLNQFKLEAVLSDALKIAMKEQGFHHYRDAFAKLRDKLR